MDILVEIELYHLNELAVYLVLIVKIIVEGVKKPGRGKGRIPFKNFLYGHPGAIMVHY
jgi:hypothetical protein